MISLRSLFTHPFTVGFSLSFCRPVPTIQWYKDGVLIAHTGVLFQYQNYNRTLRLGSISWTNHDGTYKCEAVSGLKKVSVTFDIKVMGMYLFSSLVFSL